MTNMFNKYNISQRFFIESMLDMYYVNVIDTYRVRVNNPISILEECHSLIGDWNSDKIKRFETLRQVIQETITLLKKDIDYTVDYGSFTKEFIIELLEFLVKSDEKNIDVNKLNELKYSISYILRINKGYLENLIYKIEFLLDHTDTGIPKCVPHFDKLYINISFFATELIRMGYSKITLYQLFSRTFVSTRKERTFEDNWSYVKKEITNKSKIVFTVVFKLNIHPKYDEFSSPLQLSVERSILQNPIRNRVIESFIREERSVRFKTYEIEALDFYQAIHLAREKLSSLLDIIHIGFEDVVISVNQEVLVVDTNNKNRARLRKNSFIIDGAYIKTETDKYETLKNSIDLITGNRIIEKEVKSKINSAIRYLRMGNDSYELEQKYISYWIALEHIFSINQKGSSTINRIVDYLPKIQLIHYLKRNIQYLDADVKKKISASDLKESFPFVDISLDYFLNDSNLNEFNKRINLTPLLSYKINKIKSSMHSTEKLTKYLRGHEKNVEMHIYRIYRIRNEIIHDAAIIPNIENITGNLKYYLVFTLNLLLEFYSKLPSESKVDEKLSIADFFHHQLLVYKSIESQKFKKEKLFKISTLENILI